MATRSRLHTRRLVPSYLRRERSLVGGGPNLAACVPQRPTRNRNAPGGQPVLLEPSLEVSPPCLLLLSHLRGTQEALVAQKSWVSQFPLSKSSPLCVGENRKQRNLGKGNSKVQETPPQSPYPVTALSFLREHQYRRLNSQLRLYWQCWQRCFVFFFFFGRLFFAKSLEEFWLKKIFWH